jgi:tetratricopeptide (TPR) repeat protein
MKKKFQTIIAISFLLLHVVNSNCYSSSFCIEKYKKYNSELNEILSKKDYRVSEIELLIEETKRKELSSECVEIKHIIIQMLLYAKKINEALSYAQKTLDTDNSNPYSHVYIGFVYEALGESEKAIKHLRTAYQLNPEAPFMKINFCSALGMYGYKEEANSTCGN